MLNGFDVILPPRLYAIFVGVQWRTWRRVLRLDLLSEFLQMPFDDWLRSNIARSTAVPLNDTRTGLVASIFRLTGYVWDLVIRHVPRDCNVFADRLSAWGRLHPQEVVTLDQPPLSLHA
ncbi:hypothetical protein V6N13_014230 [Hibiscus sabdariffa]